MRFRGKVYDGETLATDQASGTIDEVIAGELWKGTIRFPAGTIDMNRVGAGVVFRLETENGFSIGINIYDVSPVDAQTSEGRLRSNGPRLA